MSIANLLRGINLGNEFDIGTLVPNRIKLKIGNGLTRAADGTISATGGTPQTIEFERGFRAVGNVTAGQDINDNGAVAFTEATAETGWVIAGNAATYTGTPDKVRILITVPQEIAQGSSIQRPAPQLNLFRDGTLLTESKTGYIRDANDHEESSNTIAMIDHDPGTDPTYTLTSTQESSNGGIVSVSPPGGSAGFEAVEITSLTVLT